tara:strand:+ start:86 stop:931 length:846 start_codon:yes stop_codon:yes gene_type:complete
MIIWLASFPKSGNTWMRAFLSSYLYLDLDKENFTFNLLKKIERFPNLNQLNNIGIKPKSFLDVAKSWIPTQNHINLNNKINLLKTHQAFGNFENFPFTDSNNTLGAIYLVRDPRDVLISYSKHMKQSIDKTLDLVLEDDSKGNLFEGKNSVIGEMRGSWSQHYNSWKYSNLKEKIIIKYEDLINNPFDTFSKVISHLNYLFRKLSFPLETNAERIRKCIEISNFNNLQNLEKKSGFSDNINSGATFFNKGTTNQWQDELNDKIIYKIEKKFKKEMKELNYI